jgi:hypothetical protein
MKRLLVLAAAVTSLWLAALPASSMAAASVSISIGDPYRGTALRFRSEPDVVLVPETRVYYVRNYDHDVYRYGRYWYFVDDGRWYRARTYRGPFLYVHRTSVPRAIVQVPPRYRQGALQARRRGARRGRKEARQGSQVGPVHFGTVAGAASKASLGNCVSGAIRARNPVSN